VSIASYRVFRVLYRVLNIRIISIYAYRSLGPSVSAPRELRSDNVSIRLSEFLILLTLY